VFSRVVRGEVNGGVGFGRVSVYVNFNCLGLSVCINFMLQFVIPTAA
jgi:hypothetical protein